MRGDIKGSTINVRATNYMEQAVHRRSLFIRHLFGGAPVR
jgi:hypothetical protein